MSALALFDAQLLRRRAAPHAGPHRIGVPRPAPASWQLQDPWGEPVAVFASYPDTPALVRAAHRLSGRDWCGVLADDAGQRGRHPAWRLAALRDDRHGQPRAAGPLWLGPACPARAGEPATGLLRQAWQAAEQQLWQDGWRLRR